MIYDYRVYSCLPMQLPRLLARFENHTVAIWKRHGIRQVGFWTVEIGEGNHDLHYILAWESFAERDQKWSAFIADPAWIAARDESERAGPIIANIRTMILKPTAFSALR